MRLFALKFLVTFAKKLCSEISPLCSNPMLFSAPTMEKRAKKTKGEKLLNSNFIAKQLDSERYVESEWNVEAATHYIRQLIII